MKKNSVLVIDDENSNIITLTQMLSPEYTIYAVKNGQDGIELAEKYLPDVILLDILMPDMDGYEAIALLKKSEKTKDIPVIFITGLSRAGDEERGLALGAADYISKPFSSAIVRLRVRNQIQMLEQLKTIKKLSMTDPLTGIANRRSFDNRMRLEWEHAKRKKSVLSLLMIDIDRFKDYNDTYGHLQGDEALKEVAKSIVVTAKRSVDFTARWGGEEFAVLLPDTDMNGAFVLAEDIRKNVEDMPIACTDGPTTNITVSAGVNAATPAQEESGCIREFVDGADKALYAAKKAGRNRVCKFDT